MDCFICYEYKLDVSDPCMQCTNIICSTCSSKLFKCPICRADRIDLPTTIKYARCGTLVQKKWYLNGALHRANGPAVIKYYINGMVKSEQWWRDDKLHRFDGPAIVEYFDNGIIKRKEWAIHNELPQNNEDNVYRISYYRNGSIKIKTRKISTNIQTIEYYNNANIFREIWKNEQGEYHRVNGPAVTGWYYGGKKWYEEWWINGTISR